MTTTSLVQVKITAETIGSESFYNLCQLVTLSGYANPISALRALKAADKAEVWTAWKDANGNIVRPFPVSFHSSRIRHYTLG